jgi:hypothetical protein
MTKDTATEAVHFVLAEIRRDVVDGLYEGEDRLDSFMVLHDYCDANGYIIEAAEKFCPHDAAVDDNLLWQEWCDEVAMLVDTALAELPLVVA